MVELQKMRSLFKKANTRVVALTTDTPEQNRTIAVRLGLTMRILSDSQGIILRKLGVWDPRWEISAYGYYLLNPGLRVISRRRGYWEADEAGVRTLLKQVAAFSPRAS
ncbi:MAG: redoxin domain-containing protein [SAR324 cluster bacterium]|nr:redoxin domain-containing protein [SAR324 cluster bacterium]